MTINQLRKKIIKDYSGAWELNDGGHREEHFDAVYKCGMVINESIGDRYSDKLILLAAYFHDLFAWSRFNHHVLSGAFIQTTDYAPIVALSCHDRQLLTWACQQHRASYRHEFSHQFAELINSADRGIPSTAEALVERAIQYRLHKNPHASPEELREASIKHVKEKYGVFGYARYPALYCNVFADALSFQQDQVESLLV